MIVKAWNRGARAPKTAIVNNFSPGSTSQGKWFESQCHLGDKMEQFCKNQL